MQIGDIVKYTNTGTVGKIIAEKEQGWSNVVSTGYHSVVLSLLCTSAAEESEYRVFDQEKSLKDKLDDAEAVRKEFEDMVKDLVDVTPSGAG